MIIDTQKLTAALQTVLAEHGVPTEQTKVAFKHTFSNNDFDLSKFGLDIRGDSYEHLEIKINVDHKID